jgi:hypothetical protein
LPFLAKRVGLSVFLFIFSNIETLFLASYKTSEMIFKTTGCHDGPNWNYMFGRPLDPRCCIFGKGFRNMQERE